MKKLRNIIFNSMCAEMIQKYFVFIRPEGPPDLCVTAALQPLRGCLAAACGGPSGTALLDVGNHACAPGAVCYANVPCCQCSTPAGTALSTQSLSGEKSGLGPAQDLN